MATIQFPPDFKEFLQLLNSHDIKYLLIGGYAVAYYGYPRPTGDIDFWVARLPSNAANLVTVLVEFGFDVPGLKADSFLQERQIVRLGVPPLRLELLTSIDGVNFDECYAERTVEESMSTTDPRHIIAMGGRGFLSDDQSRTLDRYVLDQARVQNPAVCFIPTATGDADASLLRFYTLFSPLPCKLSHLVFFRRTPRDLRSLLLRQDVIYVGGGNTRSMLAVWREWGLPEILREAWESGIVLAGHSAGAICWFEQGVTDSWAEVLVSLDCLGFLPGSCCPHYDGEADRRPSFHRLLAAREIGSGIAIDDGVGVHFRGTELYRVVTPRETATAYRAEMRGDAIKEEPLSVEVKRLGASG